MKQSEATRTSGADLGNPAQRPRSSDRVLQLLVAVAEHQSGMSLTEAAQAVGLSPSTTLRQLRSLEAAQLLERGEDDQIYRCGPELLRISRIVFAGESLSAIAQPILNDLATSTGESAYLAVQNGKRQAVYVANAPGHHALRHSGWLGRSFSSSGTAVGLALEGKVEPDGAVTRVGRLEPEITACAAPVFSASREIIGAINVVGPSFRLIGAQLDEVRSIVVDRAEQLSNLLG